MEELTLLHLVEKKFVCKKVEFKYLIFSNVKVQLMELNEAKIPSRLAQMRPLIHDGEKSSFLFKWYVQVEFYNTKQKQFTF